MKKFILLCIMFLVLNNTCFSQQKTKNCKESKTNTEWKKILTPKQYYILRQAGTEKPFSSPLLEIHSEGTFHCGACNTALYKSDNKYDSGTGWPSFDRAIKNAVEYNTDYKLGYPRTEILCATCRSHLGHVFNDGPKNTTGKRHCINGNALIFNSKNINND